MLSSSIRSKPLAAAGLPPFPTDAHAVNAEQLETRLEAYPVAMVGLLRRHSLSPTLFDESRDQTPQPSSQKTDSITCSVSTQPKEQYKQSQLQMRVRGSQNVPLPPSTNLISKALRDTNVDILEMQLNRAHDDLAHLSNERNAILADLNLLHDNAATPLQAQTEEIQILQGEVSRLLTKNVTEALEYNDLLDDYLGLQAQLDRTKHRVKFLEDASTSHTSDLVGADGEPNTTRRSTRAKTKQNAQVSEQQRLREEVLKAQQTVHEISEERDALVAEKDRAYRVLRKEHLALKRKFAAISGVVPGILATAPDASTQTTTGSGGGGGEPAQKKSKSSNKGKAADNTPITKSTPGFPEDFPPPARPASPVFSLENPPPPLVIDMRVFTLDTTTPNNTVIGYVHQHSLSAGLFLRQNEDLPTLANLRRLSFNFLRASYRGAALYENANVEDFGFVARTHSLLGDRWDTMSFEGLFGFWWTAAMEFGVKSERTFVGEIDCLFVIG